MDATSPNLDRAFADGFDQGIDGSGVGCIGPNVVHAQGYDRAGHDGDKKRGGRGQVFTRPADSPTS